MATRLDLLFLPVLALASSVFGFSATTLPQTVANIQPCEIDVSATTWPSPTNDTGASFFDNWIANDHERDNINTVGANFATSNITSTKTEMAVAEAVKERDSLETDLICLALVPPLLAFFAWGPLSKGVALLFDSWNTFQTVDGNTFASDILRPTLNGIVVPAASIVLGTLFATTINVLWNRQLSIRANTNKESGELRLLRRTIFGCFGTAQHSKRRKAALGLILKYVRTLKLETQKDCIPFLQEIQQRRGISNNEMEDLADMLHGVDGAAASRQSSVNFAEDLLVSLNDHRSERVATTLNDFPTVHWLLLIFLYSSINVAFFIDSNQGVLQYLNSLQLRLIFSILIGVGSGATVLLKGLDDPFQGPFSIRLSALQLEYLEDLLESDIEEAEKEIVPSSFATDQNRDRPNYGTGNTLYFHLLTGPWASTVKVGAELVTWALRKVAKGLARMRRPFQRKGN